MEKRNRVNKFILWLLISSLFVLLAVELLSLARWILYPFYPSISYEDSSWWPVHLETRLFYLPAPLAPLLLTIMIFAWLAIPLRKYLGGVRVRVRIGQRVIALLGGRKTDVKKPAKSEMFGPKLSALALACSIVLASLFVVYPYLPSLNPDGRHVGIDFVHYEEWLFEMDGGDWVKAGEYAFFTLRGRTLSLLLIFGACEITGLSALSVLKFMPLLLVSCLILASFYFVFEATGNWTISSLAALLASSSYVVSVGMLGALFSNWIALVGVFLFSGLLIKAMRQRSWRWVSLTALILVSVLFTHTYTWTLVMGVLATYGLLLVFLKMRGENVLWKFKALGAIAVVNIVVDALRNWLLGSFGIAGEAAPIVRSNLALEFAGQFWSNINWALQNQVGGFYTNLPVLFLALLGAFYVCTREKPAYGYLASWLMLSSALFILGNTFVQWRVLYDLPIAVFAAFGLDSARRWLGSLIDREAKILEFVFILLVVLVNANYGFRCARYLLEAFVFE